MFYRVGESYDPETRLVGESNPTHTLSLSYTVLSYSITAIGYDPIYIEAVVVKNPIFL